MTLQQIVFSVGAVVAFTFCVWWKFRHHHKWSMWSKPYRLNREREIMDQYDPLDNRISRWTTHHQTRTCSSCGAIQLRRVDDDIRVFDEQ